MVEFLLGGHLEARHLAALGIHPAHHVLDGAILAAGIHCLEDNEQGMLPFRPEHLLQLLEPLSITFEFGFGFAFARIAASVRGIKVREVRLRVGRDKELLRHVRTSRFALG